MAKKRNLLLLLALLALFVAALPVTVHAADTPGAWKTISGKRYFVDGNGKKVKGWITWMNGRYYTSPKTGVMLTGKQTIDKKLYYFNPSGNYVGKAYTGWRNIKSKRFFFSPEKLAAARGWQTIGGKKYYFDADFSMHKGWRSYQKKWYYFDKKTGENLTGWIKSGSKTWYCDPTLGYRLTGWQTINDKKYYFNSSGVMQKGIVKISGKRYYFGSDGSLLVNQKDYSINGISYKISESGVLSYASDAYALAAARLDKAGWNLRKAFKWSAHHIRYRQVGTSRAPSGAKMAEYFAKIGFTRLSGDCNVMAATFYYMAKLLGYKAYFMRGSVPLARGGWGPHAWVEVVKNGRTYLCDPDYEYDDGRNGYMITYSSGGWSYANRRRIC